MTIVYADLYCHFVDGLLVLLDITLPCGYHVRCFFPCKFCVRCLDVRLILLTVKPGQQPVLDNLICKLCFSLLSKHPSSVASACEFVRDIGASGEICV